MMETKFWDIRTINEMDKLDWSEVSTRTWQWAELGKYEENLGGRAIWMRGGLEEITDFCDEYAEKVMTSGGEIHKKICILAKKDNGAYIVQIRDWLPNDSPESAGVDRLHVGVRLDSTELDQMSFQDIKKHILALCA